MRMFNMTLEQHLEEMGILPISPLEELDTVVNPVGYDEDLPTYDEETKEYLF